MSTREKTAQISGLEPQWDPATPTVLDNRADPGPLGVLAFATGSLLLNFVNAGVLDGKATALIIPVGIVLAGLIQIIVALGEYSRGNTFTYAVFGTYGAFWIIVGLWIWHFAPMAGTAGGKAFGAFIACYVLMTVIYFLCALRIEKVLAVIFALIVIALSCASISNWTGSASIGKFGGYVGIVFALIAFYKAAADILAFVYKREVLPLGKVK
ncbi:MULTISPECIES: GPR1/FUN34/YaaH family transporter [Acidithrix]|uniref:acetate uptake transporter n=1 Tax=Acidithrix TaxID=1609233 RepID=UPI000698D1F9|nr:MULTISPECIES: GPR1/FUN34/YaaH family transporter [Acidithrix]